MTKPTQSEQELRDKLAAIEHERWADWQAWCHNVIRENSPSPETLKVLERWDKQIATPYAELTEREKASDMEQVDRYWPLILSYGDTRELEGLLWVEANSDESYVGEDWFASSDVEESSARVIPLKTFRDRLATLKAQSSNKGEE